MPEVKLSTSFIESLPSLEGKAYLVYTDKVVKSLKLRVHPSGKLTYYFDHTDVNGKRIYKRLSSVDASVLAPEQARTMALEKLMLISQGVDPFPKAEKEDAKPSLSEFIHRNYLPHIKSYKRSWGTDVSLLNNHILPKIGKLSLDEIKRHHLVSLFAEHRQNHAAGSTNRMIILIRYIFNLAIRWEITSIEKNPADNIPLYPDAKKMERFLTPEETQRLFIALEESDAPMLKNIVAMLLLTGARKREVLDAKWCDFDISNRLWSIEFNKTGKPRYVPLSNYAVALLQSIPRIDGCDYPFANPKTGKPFVQIFCAWDSARKKAGMPDLRIHDLRHSFASFLVNNGRSLYEVQKLLGHTQIKTTQRYAHLANETLLDATNRASQSLPLSHILSLKSLENLS